MIFILLLFIFTKDVNCLETCGCIEYMPEQDRHVVDDWTPLDSKSTNQSIRIYTQLNSQIACDGHCSSLGFHWHAYLDEGECLCGREIAIIACEEEVGPTIDVFCNEIQVEVEVEVLGDSNDNAIYRHNDDNFVYRHNDENSLYRHIKLAGQASELPTTHSGQTTIDSSSSTINSGHTTHNSGHSTSDSSSLTTNSGHSNIRSHQIIESGHNVNDGDHKAVDSEDNRTSKTNISEKHFSESTWSTHSHTADTLDHTNHQEKTEDSKTRVNKVLALVLGLTCLLCLTLAAIRVYLQVRRLRIKEKKAMRIKNDVAFNNPVSVITKL